MLGKGMPITRRRVVESTDVFKGHSSLSRRGDAQKLDDKVPHGRSCYVSRQAD